MNIKLILCLPIMLLVSCISAPKATSVADYCLAVAAEVQFYEEQKAKGISMEEQLVRISFGLDHYPERERKKMRELVKAVYQENSNVSATIESTCVQQRNNGTWFN